MLDHDIAAVVRRAGPLIRVNDLPVCHRPHFVERLAPGVASDRADVHPFVETGVDRADGRLHRVAHKTVLAALPRVGNHPVQVAFDDLIKFVVPPAEQRLVVGRQGQIERRIRRPGESGHGKKKQRGAA